MPFDVLNDVSILELAKATILQIDCDAAVVSTCTATLVSIDAYQMHLIDHYRASDKPGMSREQHRCLGVKIGGRFCDQLFPTIEELRDHIDRAHIKYLKTWPCPFSSCTNSIFKSPLLLQEHVHLTHSLYLGLPIIRLEAYLRPSWRPASISRSSLHPPPPIPGSTCRLLSELIAPVTLPNMKLPKPFTRPSTPLLSSQSSTAFSPVKKIPQLGSIESIQSMQSTEEDLHLQDLVHPSMEKLNNGSIVVWRRPRLLGRDTVRPLPMSSEKHTSLFVPPASIHYEVFKRRIKQLRKDGILDASQS
ncbi:hypothetical protein E1B28_007424 [Marasmius oreades]|uniref:C2H2-type domain-containing protein n=1 Tax=Marasmius oreades TaxID=181124 RepID=A0A9P7S1U2_9AGAR|nr:uncharacterized protein E1B28_007424 [Marasmius oreades]KAG7093777.1 hypothetical protein E1B28_007424 [Marasmius oreades]